jgi:hypothetical protein
MLERKTEPEDSLDTLRPPPSEAPIGSSAREQKERKHRVCAVKTGISFRRGERAINLAPP